MRTTLQALFLRAGFLCYFLLVSFMLHAQGFSCNMLNTDNIVLSLNGIPDQAGIYYRVLSGTSFTFTPTSAQTVLAEGTIANKNNENQKWYVHFVLRSPQTFQQWTSAGHMYMHDPAFGCDPVDPSQWLFFEMDDAQSYFEGRDDFSGRTLNITNQPSMISFLQAGDGAGVINCEPGVALWFSFNGSHSGTADWYANANCPSNRIVTCDLGNAQNHNSILSIRKNGITKKYVTAPEGLRITQFQDGNALIEGIVQDKENANNRYRVNFKLMHARTTQQWLDLGRSYHTTCATATPNLWTIYELGPSHLYGIDGLAGQVVDVEVSKEEYGVQIGEGGSGKCGFGMGAWLKYSGDASGRGDLHAGLTVCNAVPCDSMRMCPSVFKTYLSMRGVGANKRFQPHGPLVFKQYENGTASISGIMRQVGNPDARFKLDLYMINRRSYDEWLAIGGHTHTSCDTAHREGWDIYEFGEGTLTGLGTNLGTNYNLISNHPEYGVQVGDGASGKCGFGVGMWYRTVENSNIRGDLSTTLDCDDDLVPSCNSGFASNWAPLVASEEETPTTDRAEEDKATTTKEAAATVFPNPADVFVSLQLREFEGQTVKVTIMDQLGRVLENRDIAAVASTPYQFDTSRYGVGVYTFVVTPKGQKPTAYRFVIAR